MRRVVTSFLLIAAVAGSALAGPGATSPGDPGDWSFAPGSRPYVDATPDNYVSPHHAVSKIIYLNRCIGGCTIMKSNQSDAITNLSQIGNVPVGTLMMLSEFNLSQATWDAYYTCMQEVFAPYGAEIVLEDPGTVPHHEAIVAGRASEMNITGALGVAPLDSTTCEPRDNVISFSFANDHGEDPQNLCWTTAQEVAHAYGLDHAFNCRDALTYLPGCGQKFYRNVNYQCGEFEVRTCRCGSTIQNSHQKILASFGAGTGPQLLPTVAITRPTDGGAFPAGTSVAATATAKRGIAKLELYINDWKWAETTGGSGSNYTLQVPAEVPDGVMDIRVRACDDIEVCAEQTVTVTRGAACTTADTCAAGQQCSDGRCFWAPPTVDLGGACTFDQQCLSLTCEDVGGGPICTNICQGGPNDNCPTGYSCNAPIGENGYCAPEGGGGDDGSCCSVDGSGARGATALNLGLGSALALLVARRRRRRQ